MDQAHAPLVILDRDGVINRDSADFVKSADEFEPLPGSIDAIADLCRAGYRVVIASNQSGVGRGLFTIETLGHIHGKLRGLVEAAGGGLSGIFFCPHKPDDGCECRKPKIGLMEQIGAAFERDLNGVPAIGDSMRDLEAAAAAGARPILVRTGNGRATERDLPPASDIPVYDDLRAAADAILAADGDPAR